MNPVVKYFFTLCLDVSLGLGISFDNIIRVIERKEKE